MTPDTEYIYSPAKDCHVGGIDYSVNPSFDKIRRKKPIPRYKSGHGIDRIPVGDRTSVVSPYKILFIIIVLIAILNIYAFESVMIRELRIRASQIREAIKSEVLRKEQLELKITNQLRLPEIEKTAIEKFHMRKMSPREGHQRIIYIELPPESID